MDGEDSPGALLMKQKNRFKLKLIWPATSNGASAGCAPEELMVWQSASKISLSPKDCAADFHSFAEPGSTLELRSRSRMPLFGNSGRFWRFAVGATDQAVLESFGNFALVDTTVLCSAASRASFGVSGATDGVGCSGVGIRRPRLGEDP